jgi:hypothetical protein
METTQLASLIFLFDRDLSKLESEISQYKSTNDLWKSGGGISNSAGNLCLHLCGNLQHYIGAQLGKSGYVRNRPNEFAAKGLSKEFLLAEINTTKEIVIETLKNLPDNEVQLIYPEQVLGYPMTVGFFLNHLFGHFGYHLGQINYHRRLIELM